MYDVIRTETFNSVKQWMTDIRGLYCHCKDYYTLTILTRKWLFSYLKLHTDYTNNKKKHVQLHHYGTYTLYMCVSTVLLTIVLCVSYMVMGFPFLFLLFVER